MADMTMREFGVKYFENRRETRGNRNPIKKRENINALKKARIVLKREIKNGAHDGMLNKCGLSGKSGKFGDTIVPAEVKISKQGGYDTMKVLICTSIEIGSTWNGRQIIGIKCVNMGASIKMVQMGQNVQPYVHIFSRTINPTII